MMIVNGSSLKHGILRCSFIMDDFIKGTRSRVIEEPPGLSGLNSAMCHVAPTPALSLPPLLQVLEAWKHLMEAAEGRRVKLVETGDKFRFVSMVRDLMLWMEDVIRLIEAQEKPRYGVRV